MSATGPDDDVTRMLVHDLRTPLAVVAGFAELLERKADELDDERRAEYVKRIAAAAAQMNEILDRARA
jgi:signal transduction histidine kinase